LLLHQAFCLRGAVSACLVCSLFQAVSVLFFCVLLPS
jgi:hypothetical protein